MYAISKKGHTMKLKLSVVAACICALALSTSTAYGATDNTRIAPQVSKEVAKHLSQTDDASTTLRISFGTPPLFDKEMRDQSASISMTKDAKGNTRYFMQDKEVTYKKVDQLVKKEKQLREKRIKNLQNYREKILSTLLKKYPEAKILSGADGYSDTVHISMPTKKLSLLTKDKALSAISIDLPAKLETSHSLNTIIGPATYVNPVAISRNERGNNVDLYMADVNCERMGTIANINFTLVGAAVIPKYSDYNHTVYVGGVYHTIAPASNIFCFNFDLDDSINTTRPSDTLLNNHPNIKVQNYSLNNSAHNNNYNDLDRDMDDYAYDFAHRQQSIFNSAGNIRIVSSIVYFNAVQAPAKAYNIITVGNYRGDYPNRANFQLDESSSFDNPSTGMQKPEMSAPGTNISIAGLNNPSSGTSFASPHAAAIAANRMSGNSFLRNGGSPMLKAFMLTSATQTVQNSFRATQENQNGVGVGGVSYNSQWRSLAYWWDNAGNRPFSYNGQCRTWNTWLNSGESARIAISWMVRGSYAIGKTGHNALGLDLDMSVTGPSGSSVSANSTSRTNSYEMVDITADVSGTYTANVCRVYRRDTNLRFDFGFAVAVYQ